MHSWVICSQVYETDMLSLISLTAFILFMQKILKLGS